MAKQIDMFPIINTKNEDPDKTIPEYARLTNKQMWCPYCSKPVIFNLDKKLGVRRCPFCGISEKDYNVKLVNNKWI
jgi:uncharacterized Zn-finger protein